MVRIAFVNYGIPSSCNDHPKNTTLRNSINKLGSNIIGLAETNICWIKTKSKDRWEERTRGWRESMKHLLSHIKREEPSKIFQPGGTMMLALNKPSFRGIGRGVDKSNLG